MYIPIYNNNIINKLLRFCYVLKSGEREVQKGERKINFPPHKISEIRLFRVGKKMKKKHTTIN